MNKKTRHSWPLEKAIETAKLFNSRSELFRQYPGCYMALKKAKRLEEVLPIIPRKRWTYAKIQALCSEHFIKDRQGLAFVCPTACRAAYRNGWIDTLFPSDHGA